MKKRYLITAGILVALVLVLAAMAVLRSGVQKANFALVKNGMTLEEVERVLGSRGEEDGWRGVGFRIWYAEDEFLSAYFGRDGRARHVRQDRIEISTLQRVRSWLGLDGPPPPAPPALLPTPPTPFARENYFPFRALREHE
jgi:hypothetical protein